MTLHRNIITFQHDWCMHFQSENRREAIKLELHVTVGDFLGPDMLSLQLDANRLSIEAGNW